GEGGGVLGGRFLAGAGARLGGGRIAAVVASSRSLAEDAADLVVVEYEPLEPVVSIEDALLPELPGLHEGCSNILFREAREVGDVDAAFRVAAAVVEREFRNPRNNAVPIEARGVLALPDADGLVVWSSTQIPHVLENAL